MELPDQPAASAARTGTGALLRWTLTLMLLLVGGASLAWGMKWIGGGPQGESAIDHHPTAIALGASLLAGAILFFIVHRRQHAAWHEECLAFGAAVDSLGAGARRFDLAMASVLGLFLEVALIRWHGTEFRACAYFKNITLLACFLGLGLGFARSRRAVVTFPLVLVLLALQLVTIDLLSLVDADRAVRNPVGNEIFWGMGTITNLLQAGVFYGFFATLFISTIVIFIPIGQLTGRLMDASRPIAAYTVNIVGSIIGVLLFVGVSYAWLPPVIWFGLSAAIALWLMRHSRRGLVTSGVVTVMLLGWLGYEPRTDVQNIYSPYQRLELTPYSAMLSDGTRVPLGTHLSANKTYYLHALNLSEEMVAKYSPRGITELRDKFAAYNLPYKLGATPSSVLIVGAGAGNDVAAAIRNGAGHVDAVEIDPAIRWVGQTYHPESPYSSPRVRYVIDDARAFMKRAPSGAYDLIVFGLLDSHTLLSGMAAVRLDNFVYTLESMKEAKRLLRPGGRLCLSFAVRPEGAFAARMFGMLSTAFGIAPRTFLMQGNDTLYVVGGRHEDIQTPADLALTPETTEALARYATATSVPPAEDDWPFPFLPGRSWSDFPRAYVYLIGMLAAISLMWIIGSAERGTTFSGHFFFLGAAFLLVETKGITELALVFGTTWVVSSVVILAILTLILLANWYVSLVRPRGVTGAYVLLAASLLAGYFLPVQRLFDGSALTGTIASCALCCLPLLFAGVVFATSLQRAASLPSAFASNLLGAILGGLCEYTSMVWGFRNLYLVGLGLYALSWLMAGRRRVAA